MSVCMRGDYGKGLWHRVHKDLRLFGVSEKYEQVSYTAYYRDNWAKEFAQAETRGWGDCMQREVLWYKTSQFSTKGLKTLRRTFACL